MGEQVAELAGATVPSAVVDELYARAEGNPFFTEQLVAAMAGALPGVPRPGVALPVRLAEQLVARAGRCGGAAKAVLVALAVAGRPLGEDLLGAVSGLDVDGVRAGLHELTAARLLADGSVQGEQRPRHAPLAEAVIAELLPGERAALHEAMAGALQAADDDTLAAEAAGHWAAAGRAAEELPARVRAAEAAERVFGYAAAARHWQRAVELFTEVPDPEQVTGIDLPRLYLRGLDALDASGEGERFGVLAEEAYLRFADHPDPVVAASVHLRAAWSRSERSPADARPALEQALRLFEQVPPSIDYAEAWFSYAGDLWDGRHFCADDWHTILVADISSSGGSDPWSLQQARAEVDPAAMAFTLDGAPLQTDRTPIKRYLTDQSVEAYYFQQGAVCRQAPLL